MSTPASPSAAPARPRYRPLRRNATGAAVSVAVVVALSALHAHGVVPMNLPVAVVTLVAVVATLWFLAAYLFTGAVLVAARVTARRRARRVPW